MLRLRRHRRLEEEEDFTSSGSHHAPLKPRVYSMVAAHSIRLANAIRVQPLEFTFALEMEHVQSCDFPIMLLAHASEGISQSEQAKAQHAGSHDIMFV